MDQSVPWYRSWPAVVVSAVVLPPVGLVLLWLRSRTSIAVKVLGSFAIVAVGATYFIKFVGMRVELDGTGIWPIVSLGTREDLYAELERSRREQQRIALPAPEQQPAVAAKAMQPAPDLEPAAEPPPEEESGKTPAREQAYWTDFRGPQRDGHYRQTAILTKWPGQGLERLWKQPIGGGYASFVLAGGRAFTIEQRRDQEVVAAYDIATGREVWINSWKASFSESMGGDGPRATPTWHDGRIYALGAEGELRCIDADTGKTVWSKNILTDNQAQNLQWGMAAAPLIVDDKVIVLPGGTSGKSVAAYNKQTGEPVWRALNDKQAYTSPMLVNLAGKRQVLVVSAERAMGLTPEKGEVLWEYPWVTDFGINSAQPIIVGENRFFISAGYGHGAALIEVIPRGEGFGVKEIWSNNRMKNKFTSSVLHEGHVYGLDESILACVNAETGELKWKGGRYGFGQVVLAGGHLIVVTEDGDLVLVKADPERHQELARFSAIEGKTWNHPAIAAGRLLVRNTTEMACFRIAPAAGSGK
ncbi:MAG: PQQ-binding-like beta-propeller repeat protein [Bryobacteraceae bacterium]